LERCLRRKSKNKRGVCTNNGTSRSTHLRKSLESWESGLPWFETDKPWCTGCESQSALARIVFAWQQMKQSVPNPFFRSKSCDVPRGGRPSPAAIAAAFPRFYNGGLVSK
jgi:hypothetical protein